MAKITSALNLTYLSQTCQSTNVLLMCYHVFIFVRESEWAFYYEFMSASLPPVCVSGVPFFKLKENSSMCSFCYRSPAGVVLNFANRSHISAFFNEGLYRLRTACSTGGGHHLCARSDVLLFFPEVQTNADFRRFHHMALPRLHETRWLRSSVCQEFLRQQRKQATGCNRCCKTIICRTKKCYSLILHPRT